MLLLFAGQARLALLRRREKPRTPERTGSARWGRGTSAEQGCGEAAAPWQSAFLRVECVRWCFL